MPAAELVRRRSPRDTDRNTVTVGGFGGRASGPLPLPKLHAISPPSNGTSVALLPVMRLRTLVGAFLLAASQVACSGADSVTGPGASTTAPGSDAGGRTPVADAGGGETSHSPPATNDAGSPGTQDSAAPSPEGGASAEAGPPADGIDYAPYFPTWVWGGSGYAFTGLADLQKKSGLNEVTIAFVLSNGGCNTTQDIEQNASDVKAFIAAGGHVKASFGGADGTYVEAKCTTAATLATALEDFVDATGITDLDFDIEQDPVLTDSVNAMRGQALATVQESKGIQVAFTLAANPSPNGGLTSQGLSVVSHAVERRRPDLRT